MSLSVYVCMFMFLKRINVYGYFSYSEMTVTIA